MLYVDNFSKTQKSAAKVCFFAIQTLKTCQNIEGYPFYAFFFSRIRKVVPLLISDSLMKILPL